jgi:heme-degrading monooxygenase HmoA
MILEQATLPVRPGQAAEFEAAFAQAKAIIAASPGFRSLTLSRCLERPDAYLLLVEWERLEDHTEGFRRTAAFEEWRALRITSTIRRQRWSITSRWTAWSPSFGNVDNARPMPLALHVVNAATTYRGTPQWKHPHRHDPPLDHSARA